MFRKLFHNIILVVYLVFALLLLISNISVYINPDKAWIFSLAGLAYPYLLLINSIFIFYWIYKRRLAFLISLAIIILGWSNLSAYIQIPFEPFALLKQQPTQADKRIKIMTYNVRSFNRYMWIKKNNTLDDIARLVRKENPDIICFQEFYSNRVNGFSLNRIIEKLKPAKYYCAYFSYSNQKEDGLGIVVLSKFQIVNKKQLNFAETVNTSMYCDVLIKKDTIRLFNNHLQSFNLLKGELDFFDTIRFSYDAHHKAALRTIKYKIRIANKLRARQVQHVAEYIKKSPYPVLVCGDFNDTPISYTYRVMKGDLKDMFKEKGNGIGNTYNGKIPSFRIDYVFFCKQFIPLEYKCLHLNYSDHYPVICQLAIQKK